MPKKYKLVLAINIDEYVPTRTPTIIAVAKNFTAIPPANNSENKTNRVVREVMIVRDKVWLTEIFNISINSFFLINLIFSQIFY